MKSELRFFLNGIFNGKPDGKNTTPGWPGKKNSAAFIKFSTALNIENSNSVHVFSYIKSYPVISNRKPNLGFILTKENLNAGCFGMFDNIIQLFLYNSENIQIKLFAHTGMQ